MSNITPQQSKFCRLIADGCSQSEAYMKAYPKTKTARAAESNGSRLMRNDKVKSEIQRLKSKTEAKETLTRQKKRQILAKIANGDKATAAIQAIKVDNEMTGDNAPIRVEGELSIKKAWDQISDTSGLPGRRKQ